MKVYWCVCAIALGLAGCQSGRDQMVESGYPPAFADGFSAGCSSGKAAAGAMTGTFQKNVQQYIGDKQYSSGWDDGFRQCNSKVLSEDSQEVHDRVVNDRERDWNQQIDRGKAKAYRSN